MIPPNQESGNVKAGCIPQEDLFRYLAGSTAGISPATEAHLAACPECREELGSLLKLMHPENQGPEEGPPAISGEVISSWLGLIRNVSRRD